MEKGDSFSSTNNDEEYEDVAYTAPELRFSAILDVSFFSKARYNLLILSAKFNSSAGLPYFFGIFFSIISIIQIMLSSLLINSTDLWPTNQLISKIFRVLEVFIDGPSVIHQQKRALMSLILSLIYIIFFIYIFVRSFSYAKEKIISRIEISIILFFSKYLFIAFYPHLLVGFPIACLNIVERHISVLNVIVLLFVPIVSISYMLFYCYLIESRLLLEKSPSHEWIPLIPVRVISSPICITLGSCIGILKTSTKSSLILFPIINGFIYIMSGIYVVYYSNYIKQKYVLFISTSFLTSSFISIFQIFNILYGTIKPTLILILFILLFLIFFLIIFFIQRKRVFSMMDFFNECLDFPDRCHALMDQRFKTPAIFLRQIIPVIDQWHPFFVEWKLFDYATLKWPENFDILLLYGKILSFFPRNNRSLIWISSSIIKIEGPLSAVYTVQFKQIMQERQKNMSLQLGKRIDDIRTNICVLITLIRRFWENILQKDLINFWADVDKVGQKIKDLEREIIQLTDDYPNNIEVFSLYYKFLAKLKHDPVKANEINNKITLINKQGYQKIDTSMSLSYTMFSNIRPYLQDYQEFHENSNDILNDNLDDNLNDNLNDNLVGKNSPLSYINSNTISGSNSNLYTLSMFERFDSNYLENKTDKEESENMKQFQQALQELTDHTKLGRVWVTLLVCTLMTGIVIGFFVIFSQTYVYDFIVRQEKILEFMSSSGLLRYRIVYVDLFMTLQSLFLSDKILLNQNTMYTIAPNLYTKCHELPIWRFSPPVIESIISLANNEYLSMLNSISRLENWNSLSELIKDTIDNTILYENLNFKSTMNYLFQVCKEIVHNNTIDSIFIDDLSVKVKPLFDVILPFLGNFSNLTLAYASNKNNERIDKMTSFLIAVVIIALILVSIPFAVSVFSLQMQSNAISDSFLFFPNNEIRATINKFGLSSSKKENDSTYIAKVTHRPSARADYLKLFITFFSTFFPLMICCIIMHFIALIFLNDGKKTSLQIWTLYEPFSDLVMALEYSVLVAVSDVLDYGSIYRDDYAHKISKLVSRAEEIFSNGMFGEIGTIKTYYNDDINMSYFTSCFPVDKIPQSKSLFECLVTDQFPISIDLVCASLKCLSTSLLNGKMNIDDPELLSLYFYFTDFIEDYRVSIYFDSVEKSARNTISKYRLIQNLIIGIVVFFQILAFGFIFLILTSKHNQIRDSLVFFHDLSPAAVTQNQNAVLLLSTGRIQDSHHKTSFSNAEAILSQVPIGVVLIDRQFLVTDLNYAFLRIAKCENKDISQKPITEIIHRSFDSDFDEYEKCDVNTDIFAINDNLNHAQKNYVEKRSWPNFIQHISDALNGHYQPTFSDKVTVVVGDNRNSKVTLICNAICLTADKPAVEGEHDLIEKVAIVINDISENVRKRKIIEKKQKKLAEMIINIIPKRIVNALLNGQDSISFSSQSLTVGEIDFLYNIPFDYKSSDIFSFLNNLSNECDKIINGFDLLCKVRTDGKKYIFAGGLFSRKCKPEKNSEQAIEFALKVIKVFSFKYDKNVSVKIGIQTSGPAITCVVSINQPNLQIIGPVMDIAMELADSSTLNQIHISLSVYELVFSSGFNVVEKDDIIMRDGNTISTYSVLP